MSRTINGKKPLSTKQRPTSPFGVPDFFKNKLAIPEWAQKQLDEKNLEGRYISYKAYVENGNSHDKGWVVHKFERPESISANDPGASADGIIRRGDTVLAARSKEFGDKHRAYLRQRADIQNKSYKQSKAQELKEMARQADLAVHVGYEEQDGDSDE